jgi:Adenylate and Guanylate cyclase catalytic domain
MFVTSKYNCSGNPFLLLVLSHELFTFRCLQSRFQLFGDTMNTASRMESTGLPNRIQISQETADLLAAANKSQWFVPREDKVSAKGKGQMVTHFLKLSNENDRARSIGTSSNVDPGSESGYSMVGLDCRFLDDQQALENRNRSIADWMAEVLACLLKEVELRRRAESLKSESLRKITELELSTLNNKGGDSTVIDEVAEIIELPKFNALASAKQEAKADMDDVTLSQDVTDELRDFVRTIASLYNDNRKSGSFQSS